MVLATRLKFALILLVFTLSTACADSSNTSNINDIKITNVTGKCAVQVGDAISSSKLQYPCLIAKENSQYQTFVSKGHTYYLLIGAPASKAFISNWGVKKEDKCSNEGQAFYIENSIVTFTDKKIENILLCPNLYIDEKVFYTLVN